MIRVALWLAAFVIVLPVLLVASCVAAELLARALGAEVSAKDLGNAAAGGLFTALAAIVAVIAARVA